MAAQTVQEPDRVLGSGHADVHMKGHGRLPPGEYPQRVAQRAVALRVRDLGLFPHGQWMRPRRGDAQTHRIQFGGESVPKPGELCDDRVHVRVDARLELDHRRVCLLGYVQRQLVREPWENTIAGLRERPTGRLEQHDLLLDPERIPLIKLVVPPRPQGPAPPRPIAEPTDRLAIGALVAKSLYAHRESSRPTRGSVAVTYCPAWGTPLTRSSSAAVVSSSASAATKTR